MRRRSNLDFERFHREFPGAHIKVTNATSIRCVELLETGQVDLIVVNSPNAYLGNVPNVKKIKDFQDVFIADKAFEELKGKKLSFKELLNYPILMLDRKSTTSEYLHNLFLQNQLDLVPLNKKPVLPMIIFCVLSKILKSVIRSDSFANVKLFIINVLEKASELSRIN